MESFFTNIDLSFSDYLLCAIILVMFYGLNLIEYLIEGKKAYHKTYNLKVLNAINFSGIILTIGAGLVAQYYHRSFIDSALILIPIFFIALWAFFYRQYSNSLDFTFVKSRITDIIKDELIDYAIERKGFTLEDLRNDYKAIVTLDKLIRKLSLFEKNRPLKFIVNRVEDIFTPLNFKMDDIMVILGQLVSENKLSLIDNYYSPTNHKK